MLKHSLYYHHDSAQLFERIAHLPWAMLLDSGQMGDPTTGKAGSQYGRYDIIVAEPFITLVTSGEITNITQNMRVEISTEDPFYLLKSILKKYAIPETDMDKSLPFAGGALGYFAYDLGRRVEKLPSIASDDTQVPEMMIGIYDWAIIVDHREKKTVLVSHNCHTQTQANWSRLQALFNQPVSLDALSKSTLNAFKVTSDITYNLPQPQYKQAFAKIKAYISAGDCYQVNLAQRFSAKVEGDAWQMYKKLREISSAPFMAFMQLPLAENEYLQVLSNSPERFLQVNNEHVETRPIKGTRPRFKDSTQDLNSANELLTSVKDKAENVMIVDLLQIGRASCRERVLRRV